MDWKTLRLALIRERYRKLILEPRRKMEYAPVDEWDGEPLFDDAELAGKAARPTPDSHEDQ